MIHEKTEDIINISIFYYVMLLLLRLINSYENMISSGILKQGIVYGTWIYIVAFVVMVYRGWKELSKLDFRILALTALALYTQIGFLV